VDLVHCARPRGCRRPRPVGARDRRRWPGPPGQPPGLARRVAGQQWEDAADLGKSRRSR